MTNAQIAKQIVYNINFASYYPIKRAFGKTLENCNIDAVIAYSKIVADKNVSMIEHNANFLVAGLCYNANKPNQNYDRTKINFEDLLKRLASTDKDNSKPRTKEIENFLKLRFDNNGYFSKRFISLAKKAIPMIGSNEIINYEQLLNDFKNWNNNNAVKIKWAMTITDNTTMEGN